TGRSAMMCSGIWETFELLTEAKFDWDMVLFPGHKNGIEGGASGYGICSGTKYPDQAWRVIEFFAGYQGQKIMAESGIIQPSIKELASSKIFLKSFNKTLNKKILEKAIEYLIPNPRFDGFNEFRQNV